MNVAKTPKDRIIELHSGIMQAARRSVADAIQIGQILAEQKENMKHGQFLPWIDELPFDDNTAYRYMKIYSYANKIPNVGNLQDAYQVVEQIEYQEKKTREQQDLKLVFDYKKTGKKPEGWERRHDYLYKKMLDDADFEERKKQHFEEMKQKREQEEAERRAEFERNRKPGIDSDLLKKAADHFLEEHQKRSDFKEKIRLSESGRTAPFIDAIMDYLDCLENDDRRIEACNNIVKVCRTIAVQLHQKQHGKKA